MLRYTLAALALKTFSANVATRKLYRKLGNAYNVVRRQSAPGLGVRIERGDLLVDLARKHHALKNGDRLLELGTGWMHWYALYAYLFFDLQLTGMDIWDNRQFAGLIATARKLRPVLIERGESAETIAKLDRIVAARNWEELYESTGFRYVIHPKGALTEFPDRSFELVMSFHVLEHVPRGGVETLLQDMYRVLEPGGCSIHQIGIDDHLAHYDHKASKKQYLQYSDRVWRTFFENELQYINRLQASEWEQRFAAAGFELIDRIAARPEMDALRVHPQFRHLPREDFDCTALTLVHRKPLNATV
jgi:cyclopropane fatty-acyl-phospholipid synthase-like methyltransferase